MPEIFALTIIAGALCFGAPGIIAIGVGLCVYSFATVD